MKRRHRRTGGETGGINLTPVLGIAFLLLLFLVAAVPFAQERGIDFSGCHDVDCACEFPVFIVVDNQNRIWVEEGGKAIPIDIRSVRSVVARKLAEEWNCGVLVVAEPKSKMGIVVRVVDEAKLARNPPPAVSLATVD